MPLNPLEVREVATTTRDRPDSVVSQVCAMLDVELVKLARQYGQYSLFDINLEVPLDADALILERVREEFLRAGWSYVAFSEPRETVSGWSTLFRFSA